MSVGASAKASSAPTTLVLRGYPSIAPLVLGGFLVLVGVFVFLGRSGGITCVRDASGGQCECAGRTVALNDILDITEGTEMVEVQDLTQGSRYRPRFELQRRYALVTSHGTYSFIGGLPGLSPASGLSQRFSAFRRSADAEFPSPEHVWKIGVLGLLGIAAGCGLIYMAWRRAHVVSFEVDPVRQVLLVIVRSPEGEAKFQMSTARSMSLTKGHVLSEIWLGISQDGVVHSLMPVGIGETGGKSQRAAIQAFLAAHEATCL